MKPWLKIFELWLRNIALKWGSKRQKVKKSHSFNYIYWICFISLCCLFVWTLASYLDKRAHKSNLINPNFVEFPEGTIKQPAIPSYEAMFPAPPPRATPTPLPFGRTIPPEKLSAQERERLQAIQQQGNQSMQQAFDGTPKAISISEEAP